MSAASWEGQYSAFSGLVVSVNIGHAPQLVPVSLDFSDNATTVLHKLSCPPFVQHCFDHEVSSTFRLDLENGIRQLGAIAASDLYAFDDGIATRVPFTVVFNGIPFSARMSEVGGILGVAPGSPFFASHTVAFSAIRGTVSIQVAAESGERGVTVKSTSNAQWQFRANVGGSSADVVLDLSEQDLVLPIWMRDAYLVTLRPWGYEVLNDGRLVVQCTKRPWRVSVRIYEQLEVQLPVVVSPRREDGLCKTSLRFGGGEAVILGRQFLERLDAIVLDFDSGLITFHPLTVEANEESRASTVRKPLVTVFQDPVVLESVAFREIVFASATGSEGLVLINSLSSTLFGVTARRFVRTSPAMFDASPLELDGIVEGLDFSYSNAALKFTAEPARRDTGITTFSVRIHQTRRYVSVVLMPTGHGRVSRITRLALPPPRTGVSSEGVDCAICLAELEAGQLVQAMGECVHEFHFHCIKTWLETSATTCPTCRASGAPRSASSRIVPLPADESVRDASELTVSERASCCSIS